MSVLVGLPPNVNVVLNPSNANDVEYVNLLLGNDNLVGNKSTLDLSSSTGLGNDFNLVTGSNKSVVVTKKQSQNSQSLPDSVDGFSVADGSTVVYQEHLRYKLEVPQDYTNITSVVDDTSFGVKLSENRTDSSDAMKSLQDQYRYDEVNPGTFTLMNQNSMLGVADKYGVMNGSLLQVASVPIDNKLPESFVFEQPVFNASEGLLQDIKYGTFKVSHGDAKIAVSGTHPNIVSESNGSSVSNINNVSLNTYAPNYNGGNYIQNQYEDIDSASVKINIKNNSKNQAFNNDSSNNLVNLSSSFVNVNLNGDASGNNSLGTAYPRSGDLVLKLKRNANDKDKFLVEQTEEGDVNTNFLIGYLDQEVIAEANNASKSTKVTMVSGSSHERVNLNVTDGEGSRVGNVHVFYGHSGEQNQDSSKVSSSIDSSNNVLGVNILSENNKKTDDPTYSVMVEHVATNNFKIINNPVDSSNNPVDLVIVNPAQPAKDSHKNIVFQVWEESNLEVLIDGENDQVLVPVNSAEGSNFVLRADPVDGGSEFTPESKINVQLLRDSGIASAASDNLRVYFKNRLTNGSFVEDRDSSVNGGRATGDDITQLSVVGGGNGSKASLNFVNKNDKVKFDVNDCEKGVFSVYDVNSNADAYRIVYYPRFCSGGQNLKSQLAKSSQFDSSNNRVLLPLKVEADFQELVNGVWQHVESALDNREMNDMPITSVEILQSNLVGNTRSVKIRQVLDPLVSGLASAVNLTLEYSYSYDEVTGQWSGLVKPAPEITFKMHPAWIYPHQVSLQGRSDGDWINISEPQNVNLAISYGNDNPIVLKDALTQTQTVHHCDALLKLYNNYDADAASFLNIEYSIIVNTKPGLWKAEMAQIPSFKNDLCEYFSRNDTYEVSETKLDQLLVNNPTTLSVTTLRQKVGNVSKTTLTVTDGSDNLFNVTMNSKNLQTLKGYRTKYNTVSISKVVNGVETYRDSNYSGIELYDNSALKLDDGVAVVLNKLSDSSLHFEVLLNVTLKTDKYNVSPLLSSSAPLYVSNREILPTKSTVSGHNTDAYLLYSKDNDNLEGNIFAHLYTLLKRGHQNNTVYYQLRSSDIKSMNCSASWGSNLSQTLSLPNNLASGSTNSFTLDLGKNLNISMVQNGNLLSYEEVTLNFSPNYSEVEVLLNDISVGTHLTSRVENPFNLTEAAPFVDMYKLNNFFVPEQSMTISLTQPDVIVEYQDKLSWSNFNTLNSDFESQSSVSRQLTKSSRDIKGNDDPRVWKITVNKLLRKAARTMYVTVHPPQFEVDMGYSSKSYFLYNSQALNTSYPVGEFLGNNSSHNLIVTSSTLLLAFKLKDGSSPYKVNFKPKLTVIVQGILDAGYSAYVASNNTVWNNANEYLRIELPAKDSDGKRLITVQQQHTNHTSFEENLILDLTNVFKREWSNAYTITPANKTKVCQFVLGFKLVNSKQLPVVYKLESPEFNPDELIKDRRLSNDSNSLSLIRFPLADGTAKEMVLQSELPVLPYNAPLSDSSYPSSGAVTALNSIAWSSSDINLNNPNAQLDLLVQVSNQSRGVDKFAELFRSNNSVLSVFARDQLVIKSHLNQLCMRVGPDGRLYAGDLSIFTLTAHQPPQDSNLGFLNGMLALPSNSMNSLNKLEKDRQVQSTSQQIQQP